MEKGRTLTNWSRILKLTLPGLLAVVCCLGCSSVRNPRPEDGSRIPDLAYREGVRVHSPKNELDLYIPRGEGPHPTVLFLHGGGWISGDRKMPGGLYGNVGWTLAARGYLVGVASYRLSPQFPYPAQPEDVAAAFRWMVDHSAEYGGEPSRVALIGHSAGAHLAALVAMDPRYLTSVGLTKEHIAGVVGVSGVYDLTLDGFEAYEEVLFLQPTYGFTKERRAEASPVSYVTAEAPPILLILGEEESISFGRQARALVETFEWKDRHDVRIVRIPNRTHASVIRRIGTEGDLLESILDRYLKTVFQ